MSPAILEKPYKEKAKGKKETLTGKTFEAIAKNPVIILLYGVIGFLEFAALTALFLSHSGPFNKAFGPIIRRFWGERFLHYPDNFVLLPKLATYAHFAVMATAGLIVTAIVIKKVQAYYLKEERALTTFSAAGLAFRKYFLLLLIWVPLFFILRSGTRALFPFMPAEPLVQVAILFGILLVFQSLTAFLFPAAVIAPRGYWVSLGEGIALAVMNFHKVVLILFVPILLATAMSFAKSLTPLWIRIYPELVLVVLSIGVLVGLAVNLYITCAAALLYLKARNS